MQKSVIPLGRDRKLPSFVVILDSESTFDT